MADRLLEELAARLEKLPPEQLAELDNLIHEESRALWIPNEGAQSLAYKSKADVVLFGGAAGGGKSQLLIGCAVNSHERSLILRREAVQLDGLIDSSRRILEGKWRYNGKDTEWRTVGHKSLKFGGCPLPDDWQKFAGRPRDFLGIDETESFLEEQVDSLMGWVRSSNPKQRCRVIFASNPPRSSEGRWLVDWFRPWLDPLYPNRAKAGELRWCIRHLGEIIWTEDDKAVEVGGERIKPMSYTFIPATIEDNPYYRSSDYADRLRNMKDPVLRAQLLYGDFMAGREDDPYQVIPTEWIKAAQARWQPQNNANKMVSIAADVALTTDKTTIGKLHEGNHFSPVVEMDGNKAPDGAEAAALIVTHRRDGAAIGIDCTGGYGGNTRSHLDSNKLDSIAIISSQSSDLRDMDTGLEYLNIRSEMWWEFRKALNPENPATQRQPIALPNDDVLAAQLAAPSYKVKGTKVVIESKDEIRKRLGSSTDRADAVIMAWKIRERKPKDTIQGGVKGQSIRSTRAKLGHADKKSMRR